MAFFDGESRDEVLLSEEKPAARVLEKQQQKHTYIQEGKSVTEPVEMVLFTRFNHCI